MNTVMVSEDYVQLDLPASLKNSIKQAIATRAPYVRKSEKKTFLEKSIRGQFLDAKKVRDNFDPEAIQLAAGQNLTKSGKKDARFVFQKVGSATGLTAAKARSAISKNKDKEILRIM